MKPLGILISKEGMNDKELLELAAKAAGIDANLELDGAYSLWDDAECIQSVWNPLTDDGDALRLAVKLDMRITDRVWCPNGTYSYGSENGVSADFENYNDDPYAATRRAIVRAAAEIGNGMK